jgi:hypothetical protein
VAGGGRGGLALNCRALSTPFNGKAHALQKESLPSFLHTTFQLPSPLAQTYLCVAGQDVVLGHADLEPKLAGLVVDLESLGGVALKVGDVEPVGGDPVDLERGEWSSGDQPMCGRQGNGA